MLDTEPSHWAKDVVTRDPLAALWVIIPVSVNAYYGNFAVFVAEQRSARQSTVVEISAAYIKSGSEMINVIAKLEYEW